MIYDFFVLEKHGEKKLLYLRNSEQSTFMLPNRANILELVEDLFLERKRRFFSQKTVPIFERINFQQALSYNYLFPF